MLFKRVGFSALASLSLGFGVESGIAEAAPVNGSMCSISDMSAGPIWTNITIQMLPKITYFSAVDVAAGTTGTIATSLSHTSTVTRQVTDSFGADITTKVEAGAIIAKVSFEVALKYGHEVVTTDTSTDTTETTVTWNFNAPGRYGLFRGTYLNYGVEMVSECVIRATGGIIHFEWKNTPYQYTVFTNAEEGTVSCEGPVPTLPDEFLTVPELARKRLGPC